MKHVPTRSFVNTGGDFFACRDHNGVECFDGILVCRSYAGLSVCLGILKGKFPLDVFVNLSPSGLDIFHLGASYYHPYAE